MNYASDIVAQIIHAEKEVKEYLKNCASKITENETLQEAIIGNLYHEAQEERFLMIMKKLNQIIDGI